MNGLPLQVQGLITALQLPGFVSQQFMMDDILFTCRRADTSAATRWEITLEKAVPPEEES